VRGDGLPPRWHRVESDRLAAEVAEVVSAVKHRHRLTGLVAPLEMHPMFVESLAAVGLVAVDHVHLLGHDDVPLFGPEQVKGLEFDGVVVAAPHRILDTTPTTLGARLLYVAMTRAVQELAFVTDAAPPSVLL